MELIKKNHFFKKFFLMIVFLCLSGCSNGVLSPQGNIAIQQYHLIFFVLSIMLFVVIPVFFMTFFFLWKYRDSNKNSLYLPNWNFSYKIEFIIWTLPIIIILILAFLSFRSTHNLEPSRSIISSNHPITVEVVSLDWKWLFIYPDYNIATINSLVFPIDTPISFHITSNSVMNSFFIPSLGSQIYSMKGMVNKLHLIANKVGIFKGISANYSGAGFSNMKFSVSATKNYFTFHNWINVVQKSHRTLNTLNDFKLIALADTNYHVAHFSNVLPNLFSRILILKN